MHKVGGYRLWCQELNPHVINREIIFDESLVVLARSDYSSVYANLNNVQFEVELQPKTSKVMGIGGVINTDIACNEMEPIEPIFVVTTYIDKVCVQSSNMYGCNNSFVLPMVKEVV